MTPDENRSRVETRSHSAEARFGSPGCPWVRHRLCRDAGTLHRGRDFPYPVSGKGAQVVSIGHAAHSHSFDTDKPGRRIGRIQFAISRSHRKLGWQGRSAVRKFQARRFGQGAGDGTALDIHASLLAHDGARRPGGPEPRGTAGVEGAGCVRHRSTSAQTERSEETPAARPPGPDAASRANLLPRR